MKKYLFLLLLPVFIFSCNNKDPKTTVTKEEKPAPHPGWIMQGNIYEVNVRQYSDAGTLTAFATNLDRLKEMGVQTLWFMPLNPISQLDRKGTLGSYYAVSDFTALNPEFGTMADFKKLMLSAITSFL